MSISIIGAGNVGMALGQALTQRGQRVIFGVPDPDKYRAAVERLGALAGLASTAQAIAASDTVILAVPHGALAAIAHSVPD